MTEESQEVATSGVVDRKKEPNLWQEEIIELAARW